MRAGAASLLLVAAVVAGVARAAGPEAIVRAVVRESSPRPGSTVTVLVRIEAADGVGSVPFALLYDPAILEFVPSRSTEGPFLRRDGASTTFLIAPAASRQGIASIVVGHSRLGSRAGAGGRGVLCRLTFRARAPGVSSLAFQRAAVLDPDAAPLPARFVGASVAVRPAR